MQESIVLDSASLYKQRQFEEVYKEEVWKFQKCTNPTKKWDSCMQITKSQWT